MRKTLKFLIIDDKIRLDSVSYHRELINSNERNAKIDGGGICDFFINEDFPEEKFIEFWNKSYDFGMADKQKTIEAFNNSKDEVLEILEMKGILFFGEDFNIKEWPIAIYGEDIKI